MSTHSLWSSLPTNHIWYHTSCPYSSVRVAALVGLEPHPTDAQNPCSRVHRGTSPEGITRMKIQRWPLWSNHCLGLGSRYHGGPTGWLNLEREASDLLLGVVRFVSKHIYSRVRCGLVHEMISEFSELHDSQSEPVNPSSCAHLVPLVERATGGPAWKRLDHG